MRECVLNLISFFKIQSIIHRKGLECAGTYKPYLCTLFPDTYILNNNTLITTS